MVKRRVHGEKTLLNYGERMQKGEIESIIYYDESKREIIIDLRNEWIPLDVLSFGVYQTVKSNGYRGEKT